MAHSQSKGYFPWTGEIRSETSSAAICYFRENGFVILSSHATRPETAALREAAASILSDFWDSPNQTSVFTTKDQTRKMDDTYFLASAANISCFLEEEQEEGTKPAINKIGHALHDLNDVFAAFSRSEKVRTVASAVGMQNPMLVQSMYILKNPRIGGEVRPHRDGVFVRGEPSVSGDCLGYWWALEDATQENGCLWAVPGSHRDGRALRRFKLSDNRKSTIFEGDDDLVGYDDDSYVPLPMKQGDLIIIHGSLVHRSLWNRSDKSRHAYSIHIVEDGVKNDCWLQRPADFPVQAL